MECNCLSKVSDLSEISDLSEFINIQKSVLDCQHPHEDLRKKLKEFIVSKAVVNFSRGPFKESLRKYLDFVSLSEQIAEEDKSLVSSTKIFIPKTFVVIMNLFTESRWVNLPKGLKLDKENTAFEFPDCFAEDPTMNDLCGQFHDKISFVVKNEKVLVFALPTHKLGYALKLNKKFMLGAGSYFKINNFTLFVISRNANECRVAIDGVEQPKINKGQNVVVRQDGRITPDPNDRPIAKIDFEKMCFIEPISPSSYANSSGQPIQSEIYKYLHTKEEIELRKPSKEFFIKENDIISYENINMELKKR